jgi:hypothetical protein
MTPLITSERTSLTAEQWAGLRAVAARDFCSLASVVRRAVARFLETGEAKRR